MKLWIEIKQLQGANYFWVLRTEFINLARSCTIDTKAIVECEVEKLNEVLKLPVTVSERPPVNLAGTAKLRKENVNVETQEQTQTQPSGLQTTEGLPDKQV